MKNVTVYTDGACSGNPGPGGWACVLLYGTHRRELSGYEPLTTNNRMEITAALKALQALNQPCIVDLFTDSSYLANAFSKGWIEAWQKNHWIKKDGKHPVPNSDLWELLLAETAVHQVVFHLVKGHADVAENNRCDKLATSEIKKHSQGRGSPAN